MPRPLALNMGGYQLKVLGAGGRGTETPSYFESAPFNIEKNIMIALVAARQLVNSSTRQLIIYSSTKEIEGNSKTSCYPLFIMQTLFIGASRI